MFQFDADGLTDDRPDIDGYYFASVKVNWHDVDDRRRAATIAHSLLE